MPSVLVNEELAKSFRQDEGPTEKVRVVCTQCVTSVSPNATLVAR